MAEYGGGVGRARGVSGSARGVGGRARVWCLRECAMSSCFVLHEVADRFSDSEWVFPASTGSEQPAESTRSAEEWCGDDAFDDD